MSNDGHLVHMWRQCAVCDSEENWEVGKRSLDKEEGSESQNFLRTPFVIVSLSRRRRNIDLRDDRSDRSALFSVKHLYQFHSELWRREQSNMTSNYQLLPMKSEQKLCLYTDPKKVQLSELPSSNVENIKQMSANERHNTTVTSALQWKTEHTLRFIMSRVSWKFSQCW